MSARDLAMTMLAQGIPNTTVAETIGVEPSYISSLLADEDFKAELEQKRLQSTEEDLAYDDKLDKAEEAFLERLADKVRLANLQQSMQAFRVLNGAKRRKDRGVAAQAVNSGVVVNIQLPQSVVPQYITNSRNEIVEVNGQTMVSATPTGLEGMIAARKTALPAPAQTSEATVTVQKLNRASEERAVAVLDAVGPVVRRSRRSAKDLFSVDML